MIVVCALKTHRIQRVKLFVNSAVVRKGGGNFKLVLIQSSRRFGLAASSPNLSDSSLAGWAPVLGFAALTLGPFGLAAKLDSDKFDDSTADHTRWLD